MRRKYHCRGSFSRMLRCCSRSGLVETFQWPHPTELNDIVVVVERLAHSHQHNVESARRDVFPLGDQGLSYDFAGTQMPCQSKLTRQAERTGEGTADLR